MSRPATRSGGPVPSLPPSLRAALPGGVPRGASAPSFLPRFRLLPWLLALSLLSLPLLSSPSSAAPPPPREGKAEAPSGRRDASLEALFETLRLRQGAARSFRATLVQRRKSPLLAAEAVTEGRFLFAKPDRFRWEARTPERRLIVSDGAVLTDYFPDRKEAERMEAKDPAAARLMMQFVGSGAGQPLSELSKRFRVELSRGDGALTATLTPRGGFLSRWIRSITVSQREEDGTPSRIVVVGAKGDRTETTLSDVEVDPPLSPDAFRVKLGAGVKVFDAIERKARGEDAP
jgi:outer membrane lipoprotein carrier protein